MLGHELSHVRNLDIRFALLVGVLVGGIALLADFFLRFTFWSGFGGRRSNRNDSSGGLAAVMFVVALILAIIAPIFASLVQLAVSRQREYLADASSVELTRNPYGLERALAKIAADRSRSRRPIAPRSTSTSSTRSRSSATTGRRSSRPIRPSSIASTACGADRRTAARSAEREHPGRPRIDGGNGARAISTSPPLLWFNTNQRQRAEIAQLVEHVTENHGVASSNSGSRHHLTRGLGVSADRAEVAQLVEHHLAKVRVAGSSPVFRSTLSFEDRRAFTVAPLPPAGRHIPAAGPSSSGRTPDFGSVNRGSNPRGPAKPRSSRYAGASQGDVAKW